MRAGDVELNPGPTPPSTPDQREPANAVSNPNDNDSPSQSTSMVAGTPGDISPLPHGQTQALQPTTGNSQDVSIDRRVTVAAPPLPVTHSEVRDPQHFPNQRNDPRLDNSDSEQYAPALTAHKSPHLESEPDPEKSLYVGIDARIPSKKTLDVHLDFGELRRTKSSVQLNQYKKKHDIIISEAMMRRYSISDVQCLEDSLTSRRIIFLTSANKLLRIGCNCNFCPMCYEEKKGTIKSHIFPRGLLTIFKRIHGSNEKDKLKEFIYDFSRDVRMGSRALTYPMLCDKCEKVCDEQTLRALYIFFKANPDECFKVPNEGSWLQHVLANIMFRGLLVSDSLPVDLQDKPFWQLFTTLQDYCRDTSSRMPDLYLFLLPNRPINEKLIAFLYPFEFLLKNPMFSTVIRDAKTGINFIYTKFDCFHLVLPLDRVSKDYFDRFQNGFDTFEESGHNYIKLRWTKPCVSAREFDNESQAVIYNIEEEIKPHLFPPILMNVSIQQYKRFVSMICTISKKSHLREECKMMLEYLPGLNHQYPTQDFLGDLEPVQNEFLSSQEPSESVTFTKSFAEDEMVCTAGKNSPLRLQQSKIDELHDEIKRKTNELKNMKKIIATFRKVLDKAEENVRKEKTLRLSLEKDLTRRDLDMLSMEVDYERQLSVYQQRLQVVHSLLLKERRELNRCKLENMQQKRQSKLVEENSYEALEQISHDLKKLCEGVNLELCDKLLRQCQRMKSMIKSDDDESDYNNIEIPRML